MSEFKSGKASKQGVDVFTNVRKLNFVQKQNLLESKFLTRKKNFRNSIFQNMSLEFGHQVDILKPCQNFSVFSIEFQM